MKIASIQKPMINITATEMAKLSNETAKYSKIYALDLMATGIKKDLTRRDIIKMCQKEGVLGRPMFAKDGQLTQNGRESIIDGIMEMFNISTVKDAKKVTVSQYFGKIIEMLDAEALVAEEKGLDYIIY